MRFFFSWFLLFVVKTVGKQQIQLFQPAEIVLWCCCVVLNCDIWVIPFNIIALLSLLHKLQIDFVWVVACSDEFKSSQFHVYSPESQITHSLPHRTLMLEADSQVYGAIYRLSALVFHSPSSSSSSQCKKVSVHLLYTTCYRQSWGLSDEHRRTSSSWRDQKQLKAKREYQIWFIRSTVMLLQLLDEL